MSPGCIADGAESTLERMVALNPTNRLQIVKGGCVSLCSKGPVVRENGKVRHKYIKNSDKLLETLLGESLPSELVDGYDLIQQAKQAITKKKDYVNAAQLYKEGIAKALDTAKGIAEERVSLDENGPLTQTPFNLLWLVKAHLSLAEALFETQDKDGASTAAITACELSNKSDPLCFETLSKIRQAMNDNEGELKALQSMFDIPIEEDKLQWDVANRRRELEFRLMRLNKIVK